MFSMVHGPWPRVTKDGGDLDALEAEQAAGHVTDDEVAAVRERLVGDVIAVQVDAGLDLVTDGHVRWADPERHALEAIVAIANGEAEPGFLVAAWRAAMAHTDRPVAQSVPGPYTLGHRVVEGPVIGRYDVTVGIADTLGRELRALADAGCPVVVIEEPAAVLIGGDKGERALFAEAQRRLLESVPQLHAMLATTGGSVLEAGAETIFAAPYASHLVDLIAGPDNWTLVRAAPGDRGIVCAALQAGPGLRPDQSPELVWAAHYAASSMGRGIARVGLTNATSLRRLSRRSAKNAARGLAKAARLAVMPREDAVASGLDPRTFSILPPKPVAAPVQAPRAERRRAARSSRPTRPAPES